MNDFSELVPPGFRFHPTDEELVDYYLRKKVNSRRIDLDVIKDVDLYRIEPWDLQEICRIGTGEQHEWYLFSHRDKKYPTGTRTNRATLAGFWKATGRDKAIYSKDVVIGMRKTLVFYKGRAPNGLKSDWIMHEYRLETDENGSTQEEGWVVCRVFKKRITITRKTGDPESCFWYDDQVSFVPDFDSSKISSLPNLLHQVPYLPSSFNDEQLDNQLSYQLDRFSQLPLLSSISPFQSPSLSSLCGKTAVEIDQTSLTTSPAHIFQGELHPIFSASNSNQSKNRETDWKGLEKYATADFSQVAIGNDCQNFYLNNGSELNVAFQWSKNSSDVAERASSSSCKVNQIY